MAEVGLQAGARQPHWIFLSSEAVPIFLPSGKVEIPEIFIVVEDKEKVEEASEADHAEEQHEESVEQLDHIPVDALTPELVKCYARLLNILLLLFANCLLLNFILNFFSLRCLC